MPTKKPTEITTENLPLPTIEELEKVRGGAGEEGGGGGEGFGMNWGGGGGQALLQSGHSEAM